MGLNIADEGIPEVQAALRGAFGDMGVPVRAGDGWSEVCMTGVGRGRGERR
ncbi:hypothetical protein [Salmonella enterica]|uniref:hypothetical protein n=1 Tax=Salmonella enterica TaxID=28901 RepID=UPI00166252B6|nr:hypothetical protein [Salmonella enterica]